MRTDEAEGTSPDAQRSTMDWLVHVAAPLLGLIGAVLYGVLRLSYLFFYMKLRTTPEEVGYGYVEILATQLIGAIELVLIVTALILSVTLGTRYLSTQLWTWRRPSRHRPRGPGTTRQQLWHLGRVTAVLAALIVVVLLPCLAWLEGAEAKNGYTVRNVHPRGMIALPILAVQALPAQVSYVSRTGNDLPIEDNVCLLYLGTHDGVAVFYDVRTKESIRIPTSAITIVLPNWTKVKDVCTRSSS